MKAIGRAFALVALAALGLGTSLLAVLGFGLGFGLGIIILVPMTIRLIRANARMQRRFALAWSGVEIADPYRPAPPPPVRHRDGFYHEGRQRYRSPRVPAWNQRFNWLIRDPATWRDYAFVLLDGLAVVVPVLLFLMNPWAALAGIALIAYFAPRLVRAHGRAAHALLAPTRKAALELQVNRLARTRAETMDHQTAELHRIERDLHDGAQARLVAVGMTIGAAEQLVETDPTAAKALLAKAREASATALADLRSLVRGIHPPVLAERGLGDAVRALALDSPLITHVTVELPERPDAPVESAAYFAISELLTNAARHGGATEAWIDISHAGRAMRVTVTDDGLGGADPAKGTGLAGLERRLAAFDGVLAISSPPGGPTIVTIELPQVLSPLPPVLPKHAHLIGWFMGLCWIPMIPQGFVAMAFKLSHMEQKSWFLALYLPEPFQWPVIGAMIATGLSMFTVALVLAIKQWRGDKCA
ncbi:sensor domain-containing protein [Streptosporangiaceae bacterium NEAU-GS5]|nr:sensor domain-containing protein [Streptosporangiaceae bacterium NEAU-GS5]